MTRLQEEKKLEQEIDQLEEMVADMRTDIKRINKHRHFHLLGKTDQHTKYQSVSEHSYGLSCMIACHIRDIRETRKCIDDKYNRLQTLYMWDDADADLKADTQLSFRREYEQSRWNTYEAR